MKFKVGDKVRMTGNYCNAKEGDIGTIMGLPTKEHFYYAVEFLCFKDDNSGHDCYGVVPSGLGHYVPEELLESVLTFPEKLKKFKTEHVGFLVKSEEIADELAKVFTREGMKGRYGQSPECVTKLAWEITIHGGYIAYNFSQELPGLSYGSLSGSGRSLDDLLEVTLEELKEYNSAREQKPMTLEDKLKLFKAGTHVLYTPTQEIYDKLMVELEKRGYKWCDGDKPTDDPEEWQDSKGDTCVRLLDGKLCDREKNYYENHTGLEVLTLTPEDFSAPQVITITSDGYHRVTAESNGITTEALCNPTDTFDISKGSHIALKRLLEKLVELPKDVDKKPEEDPKFYKGDIVEVVKNICGFSPDPVGLQGVVTEESENPGMGAGVKLPTYDTPAYFYKEELKLIRRATR